MKSTMDCIALELGGAAACGGGGDEMVNGSTQPWPVGFISRLCAESFDSHFGLGIRA
jgi:hypothetical protein